MKKFILNIIQTRLKHMPDLISTTATNGQDDYLRNSELEALLSSFDEQRSNKLPVYDLEGNIIGEFTFEDGPAE